MVASYMLEDGERDEVSEVREAEDRCRGFPIDQLREIELDLPADRQPNLGTLIIELVAGNRLTYVPTMAVTPKILEQLDPMVTHNGLDPLLTHFETQISFSHRDMKDHRTPNRIELLVRALGQGMKNHKTPKCPGLLERARYRGSLSDKAVHQHGL